MTKHAVFCKGKQLSLTHFLEIKPPTGMASGTVKAVSEAVGMVLRGCQNHLSPTKTISEVSASTWDTSQDPAPRDCHDFSFQSRRQVTSSSVWVVYNDS
jgi:hypothetical protein